MKIPFKKMHGLGNDFVLIDNRDEFLTLSPQYVQNLTDRRFGIGCDQLIVLESPHNPEADAFMRIFNPNGQEAGACGNASRCLGFLLSDEFKKKSCVIETKEGLLHTTRLEGNQVEVDMGAPRLLWDQIPLAHDCDTSKLPIQLGVLKEPTAVSMGNPHMVFVVPDVMAIDLLHVGQTLTKHALYPQEANVEIVEVLNPNEIRLRVYERGTGITPACGTGACAAVVAVVNRGLCQNNVKVILDGGTLDISYEETVKMTGNVAFTFEGVFNSRMMEQNLKSWTNQEPQNPSKLLPLDAA